MNHASLLLSTMGMAELLPHTSVLLSRVPGLTPAYATKAFHSESPEVLLQPCRNLNCALNV